MTKPRLSLMRHEQIAIELQDLYDRLGSLATELERAYPTRGAESLPAKALEKARREVHSARSSLESLLYSEHRGAAAPGFYFRAPHTDQPET